MTQWRYHLAIKDLFTDDDDVTDMEARRIGKQIAERLKGSRDYPADYELQRIADFFADAESVDEVNDSLVDLYDWADMNLVWIA